MSSIGHSGIETLISTEAVSIANEMQTIAGWAHSEEDVRHECNKLIDEFLQKAEIQVKGRHECSIGGGRLDSKYQGVLLEYKFPHGDGGIGDSLSSPGTKKVIQQLKQRFEDFQKDQNYRPETLFGVGCDSNRLIFVRHRSGEWEIEEPRPVTPFTVERLLRALVSLGASGYSFTAEHLADDFGAGSVTAQHGVKDLYAAILETPSAKAKTFFSEWKILFGEVCGYDIEGKNTKIDELATHYGIENPSPAELLFAVHSYYAIFMKFLAAEIASSFSPLGTSILRNCANSATASKLRREMQTLEQGGIWKQLNINNFLEGDLFSWYLAAWDSRVAKVVWEIVRTLDQYDPTTLSVEPSESHDLLKKLYQHLFPKSVRHDLGEYYTPDWLAEHVLNEIGYEGDPRKRLLDPACGSGTFLVLAINRIKQWFDEHRADCGFREGELVNLILQNVIGFDLNPLAVMAARTNYLLSIRELLRFAGPIEVPVYLCDSVGTPSEYGGLFAGAKLGTAKSLKTAVGEFVIPAEISGSREQIGKYADLLETCVKDKYSAREFLQRCLDEGLSTDFPEFHERLYSKLEELNKKDQNGIWARIIKNAFAPLFTERVDYIAGNPPWVRWGFLPADYRNDIKSLWRSYGLFTKKGLESLMGTAELDLSILFTYACLDNYLSANGTLGFLITQEVVRSKGAGEGFRAFNVLPSHTPVKAVVFHDLVRLRPFDAANKTGFIVLRKGKTTTYPVPYIEWNRKPRQSILAGDSLSDVEAKTVRTRKHASPLGGPASPWQVTTKTSGAALNKMDGTSAYRGRCGVSIDPYGVFLCRILSVNRSGCVLVENFNEGKLDIPDVPPTTIEQRRVYPIVRGRDIKRWRAIPVLGGIILNSSTRKADIPTEKEVREELPLTYSYLLSLRQWALEREKIWHFFAKKYTSSEALSEKELVNLGPYFRTAGKTDKGEFIYEILNSPFFVLFNVGPYTFSEFKVAWPMGANNMRAAVVSEYAFTTPMGETNPQSVIPATGTTSYTSFRHEQEAHFFCAVLNSRPVDAYIKSFSSAGRGFGAPSVVSKFAIPAFSSKLQLHRELELLSKKCHKAAAAEDLASLKKLESEVDRCAAKLWGLSPDELASL